MYLGKLIKRTVITLIVLALLFAGFLYGLTILYPIRYSEIIKEFAEKYDLPPELIYAVIHTESRFRAEAVSRVGASGLMQLMPATAESVAGRIGLTQPIDLVDPRTNIELGSWYLRDLIDRFEVLDTALAAYNAGRGRVAGWLRDESLSSDGVNLDHIPFGETRRYVERVNNAMPIYRTLLTIFGGRLWPLLESLGGLGILDI